MRNVRILFLSVVCLLTFCVSTAFAGSFSMLASTGTLQLGNNQAWKQEFKTDIGKFKISFRKMWNSSDKKKYHLFIEWNKNRILDGYCPTNNTGYSFKIFQDKATSRLFVALETRDRIVLMGYDPVANRLEKYVDSKDYYSKRGNPRILVDRDKDLVLSFVGDGRGIPTEYKLFWDAKNNSFGYKDITVRPAEPEVEESEYDPEYESEYEAPHYEPQSVGSADGASAATDELFYAEEEIVTGS